MEATKEKHATHTPGPWHNSGNPEYEIYKGNNPIASVIPSFTAEDEANARLIAAAPEMLEQCRLFEKVLKAIGDMGYKDEIDLDSHSWLMRTMELREVLAKVEGGEG